MYDTDFAAGLSGQYSHNTLRFAMEPNGPNWPNPPWATEIFRALLDSPTFRQDFVSRFYDLVNTHFQPERILGIIDAMQAVIENEIPHHVARWNRPNAVHAWRFHVNTMRHFANNRPSHMRQHLRDYFGLGDERQVTVRLPDAEQGYVQVNSADVQGAASGAFDWQGVYYEGLPMEIEAVPYPGYRFSHWEGLPEGAPQKTSVNLAGNLDITAHFEPLHLLHYWHFNDLLDTTHASVPADYSFSGDALITYPGTGAGYMDLVDEGTVLNTQMGAAAGNALRVRNPSDTRELILELPTTGYEEVILHYALMRTTNGVQQQALSFRVEDGGEWFAIGDPIPVTEDFVLIEQDFAFVDAVQDNPEFAVRIQFLGPEASGDSGNNRFDNITLMGQPLEETTPPPALIAPLGLQHGIEAGAPVEIDLDTVFEHPADAPLQYSVVVEHPDIAAADLQGGVMTLTPLRRGATWITVTAADGINQPLAHDFRLLAHPMPVRLQTESFNFNYWNPDAPAGTFPAHMLFLQSAVTDPGLDAPLLYPYHIPLDEYHEDDSHTVGYPYNNTRRTRLNGLGSDGISFINTGWGRDLGGAMVALDTTGIDQLLLHWTPGTVLQNERQYGIRLQYRVGLAEDFEDVLVNGIPVEYVVRDDGHLEQHGPITLPDILLDEPYVQLLWRYYHIDGDSGPRAELQIKHLMLSDQAQMYHRADLNQSGNIDLRDVLRVVQLYNSDGYHCASSEAPTEDGFAPGVNVEAQDCLPHDADFEPQDWELGLSELLRMIQLYNSPGYYRCAHGPDGFCAQL